jgi:hypothetical protein
LVEIKTIIICRDLEEEIVLTTLFSLLEQNKAIVILAHIVVTTIMDQILQMKEAHTSQDQTVEDKINIIQITMIKLSPTMVEIKVIIHIQASNHRTRLNHSLSLNHSIHHTLSPSHKTSRLSRSPSTHHSHSHNPARSHQATTSKVENQAL